VGAGQGEQAIRLPGIDVLQEKDFGIGGLGFRFLSQTALPDC